MALSFGHRILVLVPHPDDEVVGCAAAISRARAQGAKVSVLFLTHGCVDQPSMWPWKRNRYYEVVKRRALEAERAAILLDVTVAGSTTRPARHLWRQLDAGEAEVRAAVAAHHIDQIWTPAFEGGNPDHDGASAIASRLASEGMSVLEFAEYTLAHGFPRSHSFPILNGQEETLWLTPEEQATKRKGLKIYRSERGNLLFAGVRREVMRPLAAYDYAHPPHEGKLWYARFQWVPFPHPMVDFTDPAEITREIAAYAARRKARKRLVA